MGDLIAISVEERNVKDQSQVKVIIISDVCGCALRVNNFIPLLPHSDCVSLDAGELFEIFD